MRKYLILLPLLLASCSGRVSDLKRDGLKGDVKSVTETQCQPTYQEDQWVAGESIEGRSVSRYSLDGRLLERFVINRTGDTTAMVVPRYENGELVEEVYYSRMYLTPRHSKLLESTRMVLDRVSDKQVNFEEWNGDRLLNQGATYFNNRGRVNRRIQVMDDRQVTYHYVYDNNLLVENYREETSGERSGTKLFEYREFDRRGNWTECLVYIDQEKIKPDVVIRREMTYY